MSRTGVSHSWMVELHASVACILNHPATKQVTTSTGTDVVCAHIIFAAIRTMHAASNCVRVEKRNFMRNITVKFIASPISDAYPAMRISSVMSAVLPTISEAAARYIPPENCIIRTKNMNRYGFNRRGTKSGTSGISNGPCGACQSAISILHTTFHIHSGPQFCHFLRLVVGAELNSYRHTLAHFYEIAC